MKSFLLIILTAFFVLGWYGFFNGLFDVPQLVKLYINGIGMFWLTCYLNDDDYEIHLIEFAGGFVWPLLMPLALWRAYRSDY